MDDSTSSDSVLGGVALGAVENPITPRSIFGSFVAGAAGLVAMVPLAVGVPMYFGVFQLDPTAGFGTLVIAEPSRALPVVFFLVGGVVVVPLFFIVTVTYLPPLTPRYARGVTMSTIFWPGFVIGYWPAGGTLAEVAFLVVSLVSHWVYGLVLGLALNALVGIPEHEV